MAKDPAIRRQQNAERQRRWRKENPEKAAEAAIRQAQRRLERLKAARSSHVMTAQREEGAE